MLEEILRGHPVHLASLRDEQLFPQFLTDTFPLIITVNYESGDYVVPTVLAVGTVLAVQNAWYSRKKIQLSVPYLCWLRDQRNLEEKGKKQ